MAWSWSDSAATASELSAAVGSSAAMVFSPSLMPGAPRTRLSAATSTAGSVVKSCTTRMPPRCSVSRVVRSPVLTDSARYLSSSRLAQAWSVNSVLIVSSTMMLMRRG